MRKPLSSAIVVAIACTLSACAAEVPDARFDDVQSLLAARTPQRVAWRADADADREAQSAIDALLAGELSLDGAVQVALLDNPAQQAVYEELGIAQADLVQAGLLGNPVFGGHLRWPDSAPRAPNLEISVVQPFLDIFARPARERMAAAQADAAVARVADAALALQADVSTAFVTYQAALQRNAQQDLVLKASQVAAELARRQRAAGNVSELDATVQLVAAEQAQLDSLRGAAEVTESRERLARLLGPSAQRTEWRIAAALPDPPPGEPPLADLETLAVTQRLDLQAARRELDGVRGQLDYASSGLITGTDIGLSAEQDTSGQRVLGPTFQIALPLGGQRQADVLRLTAQARQTQLRLQDLEDRARSDVRLAHARARTAREVWQACVHELVPLETRLVALSQTQYDGMVLGPFTLLQARQNEVLAGRQSVEALRDLWLARWDLVRAVGGTLPDESAAEPAEPAAPPPAAPAETPSQPPESHHHHGDKP